MIRFSVLTCLSVLLFSTSAMPYRPKGKMVGKAAQDTVESDDFNGKMMLGMKEVEPPQDMDSTDFDIDPDMLIWKAVKEEIQQKYNRPEEDKDALYHPTEIQLAAEQPETFFQPLVRDQVRMYDKPEEDRDYLYHGIFGEADSALNKKLYPEEPMRGEKDAQVIGGNSRRLYSSPEEDKDGLYHADVRGEPSDKQAPPMNIFPIHTKRVHTEPEVDLDDLYHI
ncbi:uncharacterized protein si:ch211-217g15.3 [Myxocyprinus asiaticus]|uniref:uncharacterized protein si:ch211-217g15.3 n=1 Tax=Myxocyprinus asiaticus TaxID=70543 RepID=UPI0022228A58|nr:uncharacterized protein si:ch211-217g15.3 [Myxocyprinus asiaticus]